MVGALSFTVPPFTRENYLGQGGHGIVFRTGKDTAVKLVPLQTLPFPTLPYEPLEVQDLEDHLVVKGRVMELTLVAKLDLRFAQREYLALQRLQGRDHLLQAHTHSYAAVESFLCSVLEMAYVSGNTISSFREDGYGLLDIGKITMDLVDALSGLEEEGLIHGDVKPANVIYQAGSMAYQSNAVLIDFDTVLFNDDDMKISMMGSYNYFSPDHIHSDFTPALDLFSLGLVARTLILGGEELMTRYRHLPASQQSRAHLKFLYNYSNFQRDILVLELKQMGAPDAFSEAIGICLDATPSLRNPQPLRQEAQRLAMGAYPSKVYQNHYELLSL